MRITSRRPSAALIVSLIALVAALAGSAVALPGKNSVDKNDIKKNAVKSKAIKNNQVKAADIATNAVGSAEVADGSVGAADLTDPEAVHLVGAPGEPVFETGGDGDCVWQGVSSAPFPGASSFADVGFYMDPDGRVHLSGTAVNNNVGSAGDGTCGDDGGVDDSDRDGVVFVLPPAYRPAKTEAFFPHERSGGITVGALVVATDTAVPGGVTVPAGAVVVNIDGAAAPGGHSGALSGISFRAASPAAARANAKQQVRLPAGAELIP